MKKTVLITGGNKGIGLELTRYFLARAYRVIVVARDFSQFAFAGHADVEAVPFDLCEVDGIPALVAGFGSVDVLINNAGVMWSLPYDAYPPEKVDQMLKINLHAPIALIREFSRYMVAQKCGRIVNNASIAGHIGHPDIWYGITKAGLINATKSFAKILGPHGVVVNAVAAGPVETEMLDAIPEARKAAIKQAVISGRFAQPLEVAEVMGWLATESPAYMNGTCLDINNGFFPR